MLGQGSIVVQPYIGPPDKLAKPDDLFVVMPFRDDLKPVWEDHIKNVAKSLGLTVMRADDFFTAHSVMSDVWNAIYGARAIIADCTGRNPNVFYEIGIAHVIGKPVVLIAQNSDDVPFDLRHLRYILYKHTTLGMQQFEQKLAQDSQDGTESFAGQVKNRKIHLKKKCLLQAFLSQGGERSEFSLPRFRS
jgi:hypothetical protein